MKSRRINHFVGFDAATWFPLVWRYWKNIGRPNLSTVAALSGFSLFNSPLKLLESALTARQAAKVSLPSSPIFILGHWRCGTTLLHELFACDQRSIYPTTYQCFSPHHFLLTERLFSGPLSGILERAVGFHPERPQDSMAIDYASPQEDEFALMLLGAGSPYLSFLFPNQRKDFLKYRTLNTLTDSEQTLWREQWTNFLKKVMLKSKGEHLVLKSPTHSFRIPMLLDMFPEARFVHILRNPYAVFPSTLHTFKSIVRFGALESVCESDLKEWTFEMGDHMHNTLEQTLHHLPPDRFVEICYEELVKQPVSMMQDIYTGLGLTDFDEAARPGLESYLRRVADYTPNHYSVSEELHDEISRRWTPMINYYNTACKKSLL